MHIPKVLLVNDDPASLFAMETLLNSAEQCSAYQVMTARSGEEALRQVLHHEFAVIVLDVSMPGMDGFEAAEVIHSHPRAAAVPIIFITAYDADEINRLQAYQKGAVDYLHTPVIPQVLQSKVAVFVALTKSNQELKLKTEELAELYRDLRTQRLQDLRRINSELEAEIVERKKAQQRAHELAIRDPLTGLKNRRSLMERLEHAITYAARQKAQFALLFIDLDKFKPVNDSLGHEVGDELLRQVAARLTSSVRESDMVVRIGGDEFVVLLEGLTDPNHAARAAKKIASTVAEEYAVGTYSISVSASIGIGLYPQDGTSAQDLMKNADSAMYYAKEHKRGSIQFFHDELNTRQAERIQLEQELQEALQTDQFELHYRPRIDAASGRVTGVEASFQWRHPRLGLIPGQQFISTATDSGQLEALGNWVITAACTHAKTWLDSGIPSLDVPISVTLSPAQIRPELPDMVFSILSQHGLPASCLQLEITESLLMSDTEKITALLQRLHAGGIKIAVHGFGIGYSSLSLLATLPLSVLKVDRSFIREIGKKERAAAIVGAMIAMAHAMELSVVADGVENDAQVEILKSLRCDQYQGELLGKPLQAEAMMDRIRDMSRL